MDNQIGQAAPGSDASASNGYASLRNYIYWSTLIGVFSGVLVFRIPFRFLIFDGLMLLNLLLMLLLVNFARIAEWIPSFILYVAVSGGIGILNGTDTISQVAKEFLGISVSLLYFYYFFRMIGNDIERAFSTYARIAYWFAVIALPLWAGTCIYFHSYVRLQGLTSEPGAFAKSYCRPTTGTLTSISPLISTAPKFLFSLSRSYFLALPLVISAW